MAVERLPICQLGGDETGDNLIWRRAQRLSDTFGLAGPRASLIAELAWDASYAR